MDINLPGGVSGIKALATLREDLLTQHIPVIASAPTQCRTISRRDWMPGFSAI